MVCFLIQGTIGAPTNDGSQVPGSLRLPNFHRENFSQMTLHSRICRLSLAIFPRRRNLSSSSAHGSLSLITLKGAHRRFSSIQPSARLIASAGSIRELLLEEASSLTIYGVERGSKHNQSKIGAKDHIQGRERDWSEI